MNRLRAAVVCGAVAALLACSSDDGAARRDAAGDRSGAPDLARDTNGAVVPRESWAHDILHTALDVDLASKTATAVIRTTVGDGEPSASFEVQGLTIDSVSGASGDALPFALDGGRLDVFVAAKGTQTVSIEYGFAQQKGFEGLLAGGTTLVWPYHCGNLFPCKSDPADGLTFDLAVRGAPSGAKVIYPRKIAAPAPAYQIAWATGEYSDKVLGTSKGGTTLHVFTLPGDNATAVEGATASLVKVFEWYESTLGPYPFGADAGAVSADWGAGASGGMEHHPYWHVGRPSIADKSVHAHEAAHGWFGGGLRIQCWEDFVLSEGTVTYLTARALAAAEGKDTESAVWASYEIQLKQAIAQKDHVAWPEGGCNKIDVLETLFTKIPYIKGAYFYRAVEQEVGRTKIDKALRTFFSAHAGKAARMQQMLDTIKADTGFDPAALAKTWLRSTGMP